MEEKTLFKLARAITDTGTDTVSSEGGTVTYRITSLKRKLVNGKVTQTSTPSCTLSSASVSWATWGGVTVGDGYLDVKINYSENTGSSRSTTLTFTQNGSKKQEAPNVGSAPDWCAVSVAPMGTPKNHYMLSLTALSDNNTGANRLGHLFLTCGDANLSIPVTQVSTQVDTTFTLQGLTPNSNYFLFASGHFPLSNTLSQYLMIMGNGSEITLPIPCTVNMSSPGQRSEADTGDRVSVYQYSNGPFVSAGSFTVPSAGGTVSI